MCVDHNYISDDVRNAKKSISRARQLLNFLFGLFRGMILSRSVTVGLVL